MVTTQNRFNESDQDQESVARHCLAHHPKIVVGPGLESIPHITGTNLTVTEVLSRLYVHGSFKAIAEFYGDITEDQIKEAVSYTLIYMELFGKVNPRGETNELTSRRAEMAGIDTV